MGLKGALSGGEQVPVKRAWSYVCQDCRGRRSWVGDVVGEQREWRKAGGGVASASRAVLSFLLLFLADSGL